MIFLSTLLISMFITMALIPILKGVALKFNRGVDLPNPRKVHLAPMPKIGGIAMALGTLLPLLLMINGDRLMNSILIGAWIIVVFGVLDDFKNLGYRTKFLGQIMAALVVIFYGDLNICWLGECLPDDVILPRVVAAPLTLVVIVGVTNAINLSDGLDGLAGGSSLLIFICIGYLAYTCNYVPGAEIIIVFAAAMIGAIFGFLRFNTYPAIVFMGDAGSQLLGFLAVTLALGLTQSGAALSPFLPLILLGFPVLDTLVVMVERIGHGRSPFQADKNHFHHKLMRLGLFHTEAVLVIYLLTTFLVVAAFVLRFESEWFLLIFYLGFCGIVVAGFQLAEHRGWELKRQGVFDIEIKGRLKVLKEKHVLIKIAYYCMLYALPLILILAALLPAAIPEYAAWTALWLAALTAAAWRFKPKWLSALLRLSFYLMVPLLAHLGQVDPLSWVTPMSLRFYYLLYLVLAFATILTLKFTRRQKGFKATPMDFLILVIALVVPNLPDPVIQSYHLGFLATQVMVMFFCFEVLLGELRGKLIHPATGMLLALLVVAVRGII